MEKTGRKGWIMSVVVERIKRDGAEVDLAKWIYTKFYGTSYVGEGTKGRCLTDKDTGGAGLPSVGAGTGSGIRLADRDVPRHVPLSTLRVVVGPT